ECRGHEDVTARIAVQHVGHRWFVALPRGGSDGVLYELVRRSMDIVAGIAGCLVLSILFVPIAVAIKLNSPGPTFYRQERVGKRGRIFSLMKFRSMGCDAEKDGVAVWASRDDPRVTRVGRILRSTRLDELPQFVSVLWGEMSLIGPRPERPAFVEKLAAQIPFYRARLLVRPGLTGWAQVMYRYGNSTEDALTKLQYDLYYIKHRSLYLDFLIVLRTIGVVLGRSGT
ncbi:MAG: sugar transferase, partial [Chloroflexi bacterium]|nr:sugar transferase [Chloroflexota bacterium]